LDFKIKYVVYFCITDDIYWQSEDDNTYKMYGIHARWGGAGWHGGVPLNVDAVFEFDGSTIFVKKDLYYRYNDYIHKVIRSKKFSNSKRFFIIFYRFKNYLTPFYFAYACIIL